MDTSHSEEERARIDRFGGLGVMDRGAEDGEKIRGEGAKDGEGGVGGGLRESEGVAIAAAKGGFGEDTVGGSDVQEVGVVGGYLGRIGVVVMGKDGALRRWCDVSEHDFHKERAGLMEEDCGKLESWEKSVVQIIREIALWVIPSLLAEDGQIVYLIEHYAATEVLLFPERMDRDTETGTPGRILFAFVIGTIVAHTMFCEVVEIEGNRHFGKKKRSSQVLGSANGIGRPRHRMLY